MAKTYISEKTLHFWLDFLVLYATFNHEEIFKTINTKNSNIWELEDYTYSKTTPKKYIYGIDFNYKNHKVFSYVKWDTNLKIPTRDAITIYGTAFRVMNLEDIQYFIEWYFTIFKIKRIDICIDLNDDINKVVRKFNTKKSVWAQIYKKDKTLETLYIWNLKQSQNRRYVIRVYNKLADIKSSNKKKLYSDYFLYKHVTRVEVEIRRELAWTFDYQDLFNSESLKKLFRNYMKRYTEVFESIAEEDISLYRKPKELSEEDYQSIYYKKHFKKAFLWYAKSVLKTWACPVLVLIAHNVIRESTREHFWNEKIYTMHEIERQLSSKKIEDEI